jgi:hypothetical protein
VLVTIEERRYHLRLSILTLLGLTVPLAAGMISIFAWRGRTGARPVIATAVSAGIFYMGLVTLGPIMSELFTVRPQVRAALRLVRPGDEIAMINCYYPSAAFYLERVPYLVGDRGELSFGAQLTGEDARLVDEISELRRRTHGRRLLCIAPSDRKWGSDLARKLAEFELVQQNRRAALLVSRSSLTAWSEGQRHLNSRRIRRQ